MSLERENMGTVNSELKWNKLAFLGVAESSRKERKI